MCNQTEMYKEMAEYDEKSARGEVCVRGRWHDPETCPKCIKENRKKGIKEQ
jgi:hypothetical protein